MTETRKNVAIIGAGIAGVSTAVWLQREGHSVTLIDRVGPAGGASYGNGGGLASCSMVPVTMPGLIRKAPGMLFYRNQPLFLKYGYLPRLLPWLIKYLRRANADDARETARAVTGIVGDSLADHQALARGTGAERWVVPSDYLFIYNDRAHYEGDALGWQIRRENGFEWDELDEPAFRAYDPAFAPHLKFATRLGNHGRISDPGAYVTALADHVVAQGGRLIKADVEDVVRENGAVTGVRAAGETVPCDTVLVATGAWSGGLARKLGVEVPLESERGYHLELWEPSVMPKSPVMVASGKFVATPMEGRLRLAGVVEFGGLDAPPSRAPLELLKKSVQAALPGISWKREEEWMGHRPAPADSIPVIGEVPGLKGAYPGFGHHHIGLTGGPRTGLLLAQMMSGKTPNQDMRAYDPARYVT
ncbi:MAG: NAD(P)/FAD-dependent oxidoreductase [Paracoccaceae bacterium]